MKPVFIKFSNFWAWADKYGHLGYSWPIYQHPFWYCESLVFRQSSIISTETKLFISKSQIIIWDWDLNLGRKELGIYNLHM